MEIQSDFKELLELFNSHKVEYLVTGAYALAFHGAPRYTGDIDLFVNPQPVNAERIIAALHEFGFGSLGLKPDDFTEPGQIIQLGIPPARVDIIYLDIRSSLAGSGGRKSFGKLWWYSSEFPWS